MFQPIDKSKNVPSLRLTIKPLPEPSGARLLGIPIKGYVKEWVFGAWPFWFNSASAFLVIPYPVPV